MRSLHHILTLLFVTTTVALVLGSDVSRLSRAPTLRRRVAETQMMQAAAVNQGEQTMSSTSSTGAAAGNGTAGPAAMAVNGTMSNSTAATGNGTNAAGNNNGSNKGNGNNGMNGMDGKGNWMAMGKKKANAGKKKTAIVVDVNGNKVEVMLSG
ncbi:MAG: hypothetical protein Q9202_004887 [Teloschistes flavicans]